MIETLGIVVTSFFAGILATIAARAVSRRLNVMSAPNPIVPQHRERIASFGGAAVIVGATVALLPVYLVGGGSGRHIVTLVGPPALVFLAVGAIDDLRALNPSTKLALQISATGVALLWVLPRYSFRGGILGVILAAVWTLLIVNAVNVMDVCDGLVAGAAVISLGTIAFADPTSRTLVAGVIGATLGFLTLNRPPASIFLGDTGTHALGYLIAGLGLLQLNAAPSFGTGLVAMLSAAVFLFEVFVLIVARAAHGLPIWHASADHFALRLQARGFSPLRVDLLAWVCAAGYGLIALSARSASLAVACSLLAAVGVVSICGVMVVVSLDMPRPGNSTEATPRSGSVADRGPGK